MLLRSIGIAAAALLSTAGVQAAYSSSGPNVMYYWGQVSIFYCKENGNTNAYIIRILLAELLVKVH